MLPPHVTIQRNGTSTIIWAVVSTIRFLTWKDKNYDGKLRTPFTKILTYLTGFTYVDDTYLLQTEHTNDDKIEDIIEKLQGLLTIWQSTFCLTNVSLDCDDPNKSYWYSINYEWNIHERWKYCNLNDDLKLVMYNDGGPRTIAPHYRSDEAHKTLVVMLTPDDDKTLQVDTMRKITL